MESNYRKLGDFIIEVDERNKDGDVSNLIGVSISKKFMPSVANTIGTNLNNYKIIRKNTFACSLMQVSRDGGVAVSLYKEEEPSIMSPAYFIFKIKNENEVISNYLELVLNNPEFDREAVFNAVGGVRGNLTWEDFCEMKVNIPSLEEQEKIVRQYKNIHQRLAILYKKRKCINNLIYTLFEEKVLNHKFFIEEPINTNISFVNGLAMQNFRPESNQKSLPVIKIRELTQRKCDNKSEKCISTIPEKVLISSGDLVFSWSATLLIDYWNAETAGLNQHLFKVTSKKYPRWFCFNWINYHLNRFRTIAENKGTTFGHITKDDLDKSIIKIPNNLEEIKGIFNPLERQYENVCRQIYLIEKLKENFENLII